MKSFTKKQTTKNFHKWRAMLVLALLMCFGAGEAWAWSWTLRVQPGGTVQVKENTIGQEWHTYGPGPGHHKLPLHSLRQIRQHLFRCEQGIQADLPPARLGGA